MRNSDSQKSETNAGSLPSFTVFIPTYNRIGTLPAALESLMEQTCKDFEVVVVDDGSNDGTGHLISSWRSKAFFPIKYVYQENRGKPAAHNRALEEAEGVFFITLDSDDSMLPTALEEILKHWNLIPESERESFAGIGGLCLSEDGTLSGKPYPEDVMDSDFLEISASYNMRGEKRQALRTNVLRKFPYPIIKGEKHIRPTMILMRLSLEYKVRFINVALQINRHAQDGITANRFEYRMKNPKGLRLCFLEYITHFSEYFGTRKLLRHHIRYIRFSLHSGVGFTEQRREVRHAFLWLLALPAGSLKWVRDRHRKRVLGI